MKWLVALKEPISWCECARGVAGVPGAGQADCPWCGCGWMFSCLGCHRAFTYARCEEFEDMTADGLALDYLTGYLDRPLQEDDAETALMLSKFVQRIVDGLVIGREYALLDSNVVPLDSRDAVIVGIYGKHAFDVLPQEAFRGKPQKLEEFFGKTYWLEREHRPSLIREVGRPQRRK